jgi:NADPH-dependent curcumin reductase CurA
MTPVAVGESVPPDCVGIVVNFGDAGVPVGTQVATYTGWQAYATTTIGPAETADPALGGPLERISVMGTTGVTAYAGIHDIGQVGAGASVLISAATSAVGGVAVQLAKSAAASSRSRSPYSGTTAVSCCAGRSAASRPDDPEAGTDLRDAVFTRITLRGYVVSEYYPERLQPVRAEMAAMLHAKRMGAVVSEGAGPDRAPEALATVFGRGSPYIGRPIRPDLGRIGRGAAPPPRDSWWT